MIVLSLRGKIFTVDRERLIKVIGTYGSQIVMESILLIELVRDLIGH
jgi:hypothetical protein